MPFQKISLKLSKEKIDAAKARGTEQASEMLELMVDNWEQLQEKFKTQTEAEKEDMMDHFNSTIENLGDTLFGDDANIEDFKAFIGGLEDEEEEAFMSSIKEALLIEAE